MDVICSCSEKQEKAEKSSLLRQIPMNNSRRDESFPKASIAGGIHKLLQKSSKSFSQVFGTIYLLFLY